MSGEEQPISRPGSPADLSQRMDRMERNHDVLSREVGTLTGTVARVELNQNHAEELNKLRFGAIDTSLADLRTDLKSHGSTLSAFIEKIDKLLTGESDTAQSRQGRELVAEYQTWRKSVEDRFDAGEKFDTQVQTLGRVVLFLTGGSLVGTIGLIVALLNHKV